MNWAQFVVQWLHVGLGVLWFGTVLYNATILIPAISRLPLGAQRQIGGVIGDQGFRVIPPVAIAVIVLGVLRGTVFGPIKGLEDLTTAYGITWLVALAFAALGLLVAIAVPISKPLWTPSFVLVTAGISALLTAAAYRLVDRGPGRSWARPLVTLGSNALALYAASVLLFAFLLKPWQAALVRPLAAAGGATFAALAYAAGTVLVAWALAEWLYWRRVFVKV